jgi:hypothetical protein
VRIQRALRHTAIAVRALAIVAVLCMSCAAGYAQTTPASDPSQDELSTLAQQRAKQTFANLMPSGNPYSALNEVSCIDRILNTTFNLTSFFNVDNLLNAIVQRVVNRVCNRVNSSWSQFISRIPTTYQIPVDAPSWGGPDTWNAPGGATSCPTPSGPVIKATFPGPGNHLNTPGYGVWVMPSGAVMSAPLPAPVGHVTMSYTAYSPDQPAFFEISISRCQGVIDSSDPACYYGSSNDSALILAWGNIADAIAGSTCIQAKYDGTWFVNIRYTYENQCYGGSCGLSVQWNQDREMPVDPSCPTPPSDMLLMNPTTMNGPPLWPVSASGQVVTMRLPQDATTGFLVFGQSPRVFSPSDFTMDYSISRCPGVITYDNTFCNRTDVRWNIGYDIGWVGRPSSPIDTPTAAATNGLCWAPVSDGIYYFNYRLNYFQCAQNASTCGFSLSETNGPVQFGTPDCPTGFTPPSDMLTASFQDVGVWWPQRQRSGQVVSIPLPAVSSYSKMVAFGENVAALTPAPVVLEATISKCRGYIDVDAANPSNPHPNGNYCNLKSGNGTTDALTWFGKPYSTLNSAGAVNQQGYCWAPESQGQWYLNARWTYSSCLYDASTCGFSIQQNNGPY